MANEIACVIVSPTVALIVIESGVTDGGGAELYGADECGGVELRGGTELCGGALDCGALLWCELCGALELGNGTLLLHGRSEALTVGALPGGSLAGPPA